MTCPESIIVTITEQDYMLGDPAVTTDHPMSLAVGRILADASEITTLPGVIIVAGIEEKEVWYSLPEEGKRFYDICEKDGWGAEEPITFTIERWHRPPRQPEVHRKKHWWLLWR